MTNTTNRPLNDALAAAKEALEQVEERFNEGVGRDDDGAMLRLAEEALETAQENLRESDEQRQFALSESGDEFEHVWATSTQEALALTRAQIDRSNYPDGYTEEQTTIWIDIKVRCEDTDDEAEDTVQLDPDVPDCTTDEHDWRSEVEVVGGINENPGVRGNGGGVIMTEACHHCGCARITNTWAQRPDTGEQGFTSITYASERFLEEVESFREANLLAHFEITNDTHPIGVVLDNAGGGTLQVPGYCHHYDDAKEALNDARLLDQDGHEPEAALTHDAIEGSPYGYTHLELSEVATYEPS